MPKVRFSKEQLFTHI